ncbi:hypothetical protein Ancab_017900 [Ancistrocladus abbreviatus]
MESSIVRMYTADCQIKELRCVEEISELVLYPSDAAMRGQPQARSTSTSPANPSTLWPSLFDKYTQNLFPSPSTDSWLSYGLTLLVCFIFSAFYQYMEDRRLKFKAIATVPTNNGPSSINTPLLLRSRLWNRWGNPARFGTAVSFGVNSAIGYLLMLAVMSFNAGVLIAVILGLSVGYFLFRSRDFETVVVDSTCACSS